ncbi:MAG: hypothetical protein LBR17_06075 [Bacteroidales bacterium]|nr:hypothetical protein [Bacteroidales bacterium]
MIFLILKSLNTFKFLPKIVVYVLAPLLFVVAFIIKPYQVAHACRKEKPVQSKIILICGIIIDICIVAICILEITL